MNETHVYRAPVQSEPPGSLAYIQAAVEYGWTSVEAHVAYEVYPVREHYRLTLRGPLVTTGEVTQDGDTQRHGVVVTWNHFNGRWHRGPVLSQSDATDVWLTARACVNHRHRHDVGTRDVCALMAAHPTRAARI